MRFVRAVAVVWALVVLVAVAQGQKAKPPQHLVQDWSTRHVVFTGLTAGSAAAKAPTEPRAWHSWVTHAGRPAVLAAQGRGLPPIPAVLHRHKRKGLKADWNEPIFGSISPRFSPAKFSFDVNAAPDCTNDYVVFPTTNSASPGQSGGGTAASLIAFNNLYTGAGPTGICPTPLAPSDQPSVLFAYNTSTTLNGAAHLSPALSLDGKKIAFVESNDGFSNDYTAFHVLTWKAGEGTAADIAAVPGDCSAGNSCMTTLVLSNTHSDHFSSPFIDYANDVAYVADDGGTLHKIASVFGGAPTEVTTGGWPLSLTAFGGLLGSPVYDSVSGHIVVSDNTGGQLFVIDGTIPRVLIIWTGYVTLADPIVDSTNQTVFLVACRTNTLHLVVDQFDTAGNRLQEVDGGALAGDVSVFPGALDNNYFTDPATGSFYFAGAVGGTASLLQVGFTGSIMNAVASGPLALSTSATTSLPVSITEAFNPNLVSAKDRVFVGVDENCAQGSTNGCIESLDISNGLPATILDAYAVQGNSQSSVGGMVIDNVSIAPQASNIYVEAAPATGTFVSAIKLTQSGLQ
jgi:hypothetical protein